MKLKICFLLLFGLALLIDRANAQTYIASPVTGSTLAPGSYYNPTGIQINPTFSFAAASGQSLQLSTVGPDCQPMPANPSMNQNFVRIISPRIAITDEAGLQNRSSCEVMQTVQYVDGLGRPLQELQVKASPWGYDIVMPHSYDSYGREVKKYLPYSPENGAAGNYYPNAISADQQAFFTNPPSGSAVTPITTAFSETSFEASPLNRPVEQGAPGTDWQIGHHTMHMVYLSNNDTTFTADSLKSRQVALYTTTINSNGSQTLNRAGNTATYGNGTLTVTVDKDENWLSGRAGTVEEYKDVDGKVVLKRFYNYAGGKVQQLSTYYVYDDKGKLAFVLPPGAKPDSTGAISTATLNNFCYQYQYDGLGRIIQKKLPGKGWEYTVYNVMDQPVATQDSLQRANNQWIFSKYDALGRVAMTGIWTNGGTAVSRASLQSTLDGINSNLYEAQTTTGNGYTNVAWPISSTTTLTINYYDGYDHAPGMPSRFTTPAGANGSTQGELTATKTSVLNTPADMLWTAHYFDNWDRSLTAYSQHYLGGTVNANNFDAISNTYNFTNAPTTTTRKHWNNNNTSYPLVTITNTYLYDHMGRKLKSWEQIQNLNSTPTTKTLISQTAYNEIAQLKSKSLQSTDSTNFQQSIAYTYNERGWLLSSTAGLFEMKLVYNGNPTNKQYNGNIAYQSWGTQAAPDTKTYTYTYDRLNRLLSGGASDHYGERGITYDLMGNVLTLNRLYNNVVIDSMAYSYATGNYINSINDRSPDASGTGYPTGTHAYTYDGNGNVHTDGSKGSGITIGYNLLNLPQTITGSKTITYTYDASGRKLRRVSPVTGTTDYIDGIQYDGTTPALTFIQTEEGKAVPNGAGYEYVYYLGDNLGNTRVTFGTKTGSAVSYQQDDYLPFGLEINRSVLSPKNEYLYNKKELQEELGQYDYGARFYDPQIARWEVVDHLAEKNYSGSVYGFVENNPILLIDPNGMAAVGPGDLFLSLEDAAHDFGKTYNGISIMYNRELSTSFYKTQVDGKTMYSYSEPAVGTRTNSSPSGYPKGTTRVAVGHLHSAYALPSDDYFSGSKEAPMPKGQPGDLLVVYIYRVDVQFLGTPNGSLQEYDVKTKKIITLFNDLPSDEKDPTRKNHIPPSGPVGIGPTPFPPLFDPEHKIIDDTNNNVDHNPFAPPKPNKRGRGFGKNENKERGRDSNNY